MFICSFDQKVVSYYEQVIVAKLSNVLVSYHPMSYSSQVLSQYTSSRLL